MENIFMEVAKRQIFLALEFVLLHCPAINNVIQFSASAFRSTLIPGRDKKILGKSLN